MPKSNALKTQNLIENKIDGYVLPQSALSEINRYTTVFAEQVGLLPYIWLNAKYSSKSDSTPANATNPLVFNLGNKARNVELIPASISSGVATQATTKGSLNNVYDTFNDVDGFASTVTGLLDVTTIGADRPLFNLSGAKTIALNQPQYDGHITVSFSITANTSANQSLLVSANTGGLEIFTNGTSNIVMGSKGGVNVSFATALTTDATHITVTWHKTTKQAILYTNGVQVDADDAVTLDTDIAQENLTIGTLDGAIQNFMVMNDFLNWEKARNLYLACAYQHGLTEIPAVTFTPDVSQIGLVKDGLIYHMNPTSDKVSLTGSLVDSVADSSGRGNTLTGTGSERPTYIESDTNGFPALDFDGSDDTMTLTSTLALSGEFTRFVVSSRDGTETRFYLGHASGDSLEGQVSPGNFALRVVTGGSSDTGQPYPVNVSSNSSDPVAVGITRDSSNLVDAYLNSKTSTSMFGGAAKAGTENVTTIGSRGGGFDWDGKIYEILVYNRKLTDFEIESVLDYLNSKFNLF